MDIGILISFVIASLLLALSPGPDNIYVLIQSAVNGRMYGLATVLGLISGCLVHTSLVAFGASVIIKSNDTLFLLLRICGAAYLLYLAYRVFRQPSAIQLGSDEVKRNGLQRQFIQGFFMNVLNPKVSIFFLALFPAFLFSSEMSTVIQFFILGILFMLASLFVFSAIAILAGSISDFIKGHPGVGKFLKWMQIVVFVGIGIFILLSEK